MPFYNSARTIGEAVDGILSQSVADLELVLVNDGSTDGSLALARDHASRDPRVVLIGDDQNRGLVERLNQGLALCRGEFIARIDADDRAYRHRFARQIEYLERHDRVIAVSSAAMVTDGARRTATPGGTFTRFRRLSPIFHTRC
jgi:glycosyltransferase involved in cell wall biosynthesis